jgi:hypothetical protein
MEKVYVVKSVNTDEFGVMADDKGLGVFLTYEEAKECFRQNVADLQELYEEEEIEYYDCSVPDDDGNDWEFYARYYRNGKPITDYVAIYECEIGEWNS